MQSIAKKLQPASGPEITNNGSFGKTTDPSFTAITVTSDVFNCLKKV